MDDLVKRLQDYLDCRPWAAGRTFDPTHPECLIAQAKDRIEELEAALRWMIDIKVDETNAEDCVKFMQEEARHALGEKKDG
jgi:hypothetical protein